MTGLDAPLVKGFLVMDPSPEELHFLDGLYFFVRNLDFFGVMSLKYNLCWCCFDYFFLNFFVTESRVET